MQGVVSIKELYKAKRLTNGRLMLSMEDTRPVSAQAGSHELLLEQTPNVDHVIERIIASNQKIYAMWQITY